MKMLLPIPPPPTPEGRPASRGQILVVDDDPALLQLSLVTLQSAGYSVTCVSHAAVCLTALGEARPDLILLDINLPGMSGLELSRRIKADPAHAGVAIVHISGARISRADQMEAMECGADGFLVRPISSHQLVARVEEMLRVKRAEAEVRQLNHKLGNASRALQQIMDHSLDIICTINAQGEFVEVSAAAARIWGYPWEELIGRRYLDLVHPDDRAKTEAAAAAITAGSATLDFENRYCGGDGQVVHMMWSAVWSPAEKMMFCVARDVTARREQDRQLRESEERFRQLAENVEEAFWIVDLQPRRMIYGNPACQRLSGQPAARLHLDAAGYLDSIHPQDRERVRLAAGQTPGAFNEEYRVRQPDGKIRWHWARAFPIHDAEGRLYRVGGIGRDITERKEAEGLIREQAALLDSAQEAIFVQDLEGSILFWNRGAAQIYGRPAEEILGRPFAPATERGGEKHAEARRLVLEQGDWRGEEIEETRDGRKLTIDEHWTLVRDSDGAPKSILCIHTDITARKRLEGQFLRAQRMESIGTLAGGIAHDLNNALSPILMSIELLKQSHGDSSTNELLETIEANARRGADMVRQVLSFALGVEGERFLVQPKYLIKDMKKIAGDTFPKNIDLVIATTPDLWNVIGDATQLHQVLVNLCLNARDAMPTGGRLTITAENRMLDENYAVMNSEAHAGPHIAINVQDTGTGIPPELLDRIFDPFFTTKALGKGTGLGLSTSLAIVKSHGGFIRAYSEVGRGSSFKVHLPAHGGLAAEAGDPAPVSLPRGHGELIMVGDDEASIRTITRQTLESFGYRCLLASDGAEAVALFAKHRAEVAAVIIDMMMPMMDGPTTIQILRRLNPALPIIAASGLAASGHETRIAGFDVKHFLAKPFTAEVLLKTLKAVLPADAPPDDRGQASQPPSL